MAVMLYHVAGNPHSDTMLMAYFPRDRMASLVVGTMAVVLEDGGYRQVARGDDITVERPFPVRVRLPR